MKRIRKWLDDNRIEYTFKQNEMERESVISIMIEPNCVWINGFGEPMNYDHKVFIKSFKNGGYYVGERYGYSMSKKIISTGKQTSVIDALERRFFDNSENNGNQHS